MQQIGVFSFGLLLALGFWPGSMDAPLTLRWSLAAVGIPLLLLSQASLKSTSGAFTGVLLASCLLPGITLFYSPERLGGLDDYFHLLILAGAAYWGSTACLGAFWRGLAVGVGVGALIAVGQRFGGLQWFDQAAPPAGLFGNRNVLAEAGMVAFIYAACARKWFLAGLTALAVALPLSLAAFGGLLVALAARCYPKYPTASRALLYGLVVAVVVDFAVSSLRPCDFGCPQVSDGITLRLLTWTSALSDSKLFGHGLGSFAYAYPNMEYAHSEPVQAVYELGIFSLPLVLLLGVALFFGDHDAPEYYILLVLLATSFLSFPFHMPLTALATAVSAGKLAADGLRVRVVQPPRSILTGGSGKPDKGTGGAAGAGGRGGKDIPALLTPAKATQNPA